MARNIRLNSVKANNLKQLQNKITKEALVYMGAEIIVASGVKLHYLRPVARQVGEHLEANQAEAVDGLE